MAKIELVVCDVDKDPTRPVKTYRITVDGQSYTTDLCDEHSAPIRELIRIAEGKPEPTTTREIPTRATSRRVSTTRKRGGFAAKVKTIEEIEAEKRGK